MKRLFAAVKIHPSSDFLITYRSLVAGLRFAQITWVKPESVHVTLKFFGETMENRIPEISRVLKEVALKHQPFVSEIVDVGIFGSSYNPKVLWFGIEKAEPFKELGADVLKSVEAIGWEHERQNFVPHITIGRIKNIEDKHLFQSVIDLHKKTWMQQVQVNEFHLFESNLTRQGPIYRVLETFKLKG
jgi:RNA 2',3'-cyclic 3'-phosphodiesterase